MCNHEFFLENTISSYNRKGDSRFLAAFHRVCLSCADRYIYFPGAPVGSEAFLRGSKAKAALEKLRKELN